MNILTCSLPATRSLLAGRSLLAIVGATFFFSSSAHAFCLTTTCDPDLSCADDPEECCEYDENLCDVRGEPVSWHNSCVSYNTHEAGSVLRGITQSQLETTLETAYDQWFSVSCAGQPLPLALEARGAASCGAPEFNANPGETNANVWMFQDDPSKTNNVSDTHGGIDASSLAVSVITYDYSTAELVDVDVEFNSAAAAFTLGDEAVNIDLLSVATHEAGHFLGLEHSIQAGATMRARYEPTDISPRDLTEDDKAAICAAYPADRDISESNQNCEPYNGYSPDCYEEGCGCKSVGRSTPIGRSAWLGLVILGSLFLGRRRLYHARFS